MNLVELLDRRDWMTDAACRGMDPSVFFVSHADTSGASRRARRICADCPVSEQCLEYALANHETTHGFWGGTSPLERRRLMRERSARREAS